MDFILEMASKVGYMVRCTGANLIRIIPREPAPYVEGSMDEIARYLVRLSRQA